MVYYNENDPNAVAWLRQLIKDGLIADGVVDDRSIVDVQPRDLDGYTQHHFFAGIGGWSAALRLAGVPDDEPIWTGSCPCQPYSAAGKGLGDADARNLWPAFFRLIRVCRPDTIYGEQVESAVGHGWLDGISADLEGEGYAVGATVLGAHSVGAPHKRQRLYWVADAIGERRTGIDALLRAENNGRNGAREVSEIAGGSANDSGGLPDASHTERRTERIAGQNGCDGPDSRREEAHGVAGTCGEVRASDGGVAQSQGQGRPRVESECTCGQCERARVGGGGTDGGVEDAASERWDVERNDSDAAVRRQEPVRVASSVYERLGHAHESRSQGQFERGNGSSEWSLGSPGLGHWYGTASVQCSDGKSRRIKPGIQPLAHGVSGRVGLLRGAGNAIVPQCAAAFIQAHRAATGAGRVMQIVLD